MSSVTVETDGHVLLIGVDRPAKRNAWDLAVIREVGQAYDRLAADDDVRVGVVFGHGDHFSAGLDLAEVLPAVQRNGPGVLSGAGRHDPSGLWAAPAPKPVVMAAQGIAFTLSVELALASDSVVAADD
ncbi:MAG: enoyl-CoA hydratase, partial [Frankiales bacterium]|nr:enoyl-CoA hydratase [Frankiales bacterium]